MTTVPRIRLELLRENTGLEPVDMAVHKLYQLDKRAQSILRRQVLPGTPGWDRDRLEYRLNDQGLRMAAHLLGLPQTTSQERIREVFSRQPWIGSIEHFTILKSFEAMRWTIGNSSGAPQQSGTPNTSPARLSQQQ